MSVLEGLEGSRADVVGLWGRRGFVTLLLAVVLAGPAGLLGVRSADASAREGEWSLHLEYAAVARAGLDVPWTATVRHEGGFPADTPVTLVITGDYLDLYESQGFRPEPASSRRDGDTLYLAFDAPPSGDELVVGFDAYVQPAAQRGRFATLAVLSGGRRYAPVTFRTRLLP
ncbi:hypothetical protein [Nocardioides flavescens]|uniref:Uncharacterized protein n=1 Tax=Nocardioides flavescens TaxID=2691959 RepID=A0A6L7F3D5_9ACTN|nr:hypothetical protein [Nocardioides flavescens]MXG91736.1 hypothetical protein [Nocardioides flavescens]